MKTINIKNTVMPSPGTVINISRGFDPDEKQPCWYANLNIDEGRNEAAWTVGVKREGEDSVEYSFRLSKAGDVNDDEFWKYITSPDFAVALIDLFRVGGEKAVASWVKNGCL